jgi:hypothetical protein
MIKKHLPQFSLFLSNFLIFFQSKTHSSPIIPKYNQENTQFLTAFCFFENVFRVNTRNVFFVLTLFFFVSFANAATITSTAAGGTWATGATWVGGIAPSAGDNVIIATTGVGSVSLAASASVANLTINSGAILKITGFTLTITGDFVNNGGTFTGGTGIVALTGNFTNTGAFTLSTGSLTVTVGNFNNSGNFSFSAAGGLNLGGNYSNTGTVTLLSAKVQFTGSANQTIQAFTTTGSVTMSKSLGTATFVGNVNGAALTLNGSGGILNLGAGLTHVFTGIVSLTNGLLNGGSSTLNVNVTSTTAWNGSGANFSAGTGTVKFGGAGQTLVTASTFNNLILAGSGTKAFTVSPTINGILSMEGTAIVGTTAPTYGPAATLRYNRTAATTTATLEWITPFIATGGVNIINTGTIALNANKIFNTSIPLVISPVSTLNIATRTLTLNDAYTNSATIKGTTGFLTVTGNFTNSGTLTYSTTGLLSVGGNFNNTGNITFTAAGTTGGLILAGNYSNSGAVALGTAKVQFIGTASQMIQGFTTTGVVSMLKTGGIATLTSSVVAGGLTINGSGGNLNLGSGLSHTFSGVWTRTNGTLDCGSSILRIGSNISGTGGIFSAGTGTVEYYNNTVTQAGAVVNYNNLTLSGALGKTFGTAPTINGILSMEGSATISIAPTYGTAATLRYNTAGARNAGLEWKTPFTATGGVIIANTGTITSTGNKTFTSAPLTINNGAILDNGGFTITGGSTLSIVSGGTLKLSGTSTFPTGFTTFTVEPTSTVEYSGAIQTVTARNYGNLVLSGTVSSVNKTFLAATTVVGNLSINGTAVALFPNISTSSSQSLTFDGITQSSAGSWGGTGSPAANKNATRFGTTTTGILNILSSCLAGTWLGTIDTDWNNAGNWCGGVKPTAATDIIITNLTNQPVINTATACRNVIIGNGAFLSVAGLNSPITVGGNWNNSGTFNAGSSIMSISGNWNNSGTFNANTSNVLLGGNFANSGTFNANTSTVNFNGIGSQEIGGSSSIIFFNLTNSNTVASLTATAGFTVNNNLNIADMAVLDMATFALGGSGSFTNSGLGQLKTTSTSAAPLPSGETWTSSVIYSNLTGGQTIVGGIYNASPSLVLGNTSGTQTASGNISIGNQLGIDNGGTQTFKMNGFDLNTASLDLSDTGTILDMGAGNLSYTELAAMEGTVRFSGLSNGKPFPSGTVEYNGGVQNVAVGTYYNLLFSGLSGDYSFGNNTAVNNSLTVTNGSVKVSDSFSLLVSNALTVTAPGTLTLENNASLVQTGITNANIGNINVKRNSAPILLDDFIYWSSSTSGTQTLKEFSPNTQSDKYFDYNNDWANVNAATTVFAPGIGYAIRSPEGSGTVTPAVDTSFKFTGIPNNGTITIPVTVRISGPDIGTGERLVGNPYPSAIDADDFIDANITTGTGTKTISGTLYFWTHNHRVNGNDYDDVDYATYTKAGGVGTLQASSGTGNNNAPTKNIASGQGFFVEVDAPGNIVFDNSMRDVANTNTNFYKSTSVLKKQQDLELKNRIWLNLTNSSKGSQSLVGYIANATNNYDPGYDGLVFNDASPFALYSLLGTAKLAIQARTEFVDTDIVPLGYAIDLAGNATIAIDHMDGLFLDDQNIYLEDKLLNIVHDIKSKAYNFTSAAGTFNDRFVLRFTDKTLGNETFDLNNKNVLITKDRTELKIKSAFENIKRVTVFDLLGRKVFDKVAIDTNEFQTSNIALSKQTVLVKVTLADGKIVTKKVIY